MYRDVLELKQFYDSRLGRIAQRILRHRIREIWPDVSGQNLAGLGYPVPYLSPFRGEAERVIALMPASQGVLYWPRGESNLVTLARESELPLAAESVDRMLIVHGLECTETLRASLSELWRVMSGSGRVLIVVPNRLGLWARVDRTPFGQGMPFTSYQLQRMLSDHGFVHERTCRALFFPPAQMRLIHAAAPAWEKAGRYLPLFAGVNLVEASKQLYAGTGMTAAARRKVEDPQGAVPAC